MQERIVSDSAQIADSASPRSRVLVVDDDPRIRNLLSAVLTKAGYEVLAARSGEEAWTLFGQSLRRMAALVSDIDMPGMSGVELAKLASGACPTLPILLISGSPFPSYAQALSCGFLQKPFRAATFLQSVRGVVNQSKAPTSECAAALLPE